MARQSYPARVLGRVAAWVAAWAFSAALYLLLIDITDLPELIVGAVAAALAATGFELAREQHIAGVATQLSWLRRLHRPLLAAPLDIALVSVTALERLLRPRAPAGAFRAVRFRCSGPSELESGRYALVEAFGSFAPNTIVVGVDPDRDALLVHQLRRRAGADDADLLGLG